MKKFMVFYKAPIAAFEKAMAEMTPAEQQNEMQAWIKWMDANKASIVEGGAPLGKTKRVDATGAADAKNDIGGYGIIQANSREDAAKLFGKDHPHLKMPGAWIEITEIMAMPGM